MDLPPEATQAEADELRRSLYRSIESKDAREIRRIIAHSIWADLLDVHSAPSRRPPARSSPPGVALQSTATQGLTCAPSFHAASLWTRAPRFLMTPLQASAAAGGRGHLRPCRCCGRRPCGGTHRPHAPRLSPSCPPGA